MDIIVNTARGAGAWLDTAAGTEDAGAQRRPVFRVPDTWRKEPALVEELTVTRITTHSVAVHASRGP